MPLAPPTEENVRCALRAVRDPARGEDIVTLGMVEGVHIQEQPDGGTEILCVLQVDPARGTSLEPLRQKAEAILYELAGVRKATVVLTAEHAPEASAPRSSPPPASDPHGMGKNPRLDLPFDHIIAVASGKGGVGKSTVAFNLAVALGANGLRVGLLDADVYGPSVPRLAGIVGKKPDVDDSGALIPLSAHGIALMSMGFLVAEETPMIWRGPMVQTAIYQLLRDVAWGDLDVLVVDMPPGTGDAQLTLAQKVPLSGAVIVSTPQDLALIDARKGLEMFRKVNVPILGLVENMSMYCCPQCGHEDPVFGHGGAREQAEKLACPFLGEIPLTGQIRQDSDAGVPVVSTRPDSPPAQAFRKIAQGVAGALGISFPFDPVHDITRSS